MKNRLIKECMEIMAKLEQLDADDYKRPPSRPSLRCPIVSVREKERERKIIAQTIEEGLKVTDWSAEERFYNRSRKIRRKVWRWLFDSRGRLFSTEESMSAECANAAGCSSVTARRWIHQYSQSNSDFYVQDTISGYVIWTRADMKEG